MVAFAPCARTCRSDLSEILYPPEFWRLKRGDQITVFVWEGPTIAPRLRRHVGRFLGWDSVHCLVWLLLDRGFVEPHQLPAHDISHIERE